MWPCDQVLVNGTKAEVSYMLPRRVLGEGVCPAPCHSSVLLAGRQMVVAGARTAIQTIQWQSYSEKQQTMRCEVYRRLAYQLWAAHGFV